MTTYSCPVCLDVVDVRAFLGRHRWLRLNPEGYRDVVVCSCGHIVEFRDLRGVVARSSDAEARPSAMSA